MEPLAVDIISKMLCGEASKVTESDLRRFVDEYHENSATVIFLNAALEQLIALSGARVQQDTPAYIDVYQNGTNADLAQELYDYLTNDGLPEVQDV